MKTSTALSGFLKMLKCSAAKGGGKLTELLDKYGIQLPFIKAKWPYTIASYRAWCIVTGYGGEFLSYRPDSSLYTKFCSYLAPGLLLCHRMFWGFFSEPVFILSDQGRTGWVRIWALIDMKSTIASGWPRETTSSLRKQQTGGRRGSHGSIWE